MSKYYYTKRNVPLIRKTVKFTGLSLALVGIISMIYFSFPILSYYIYLKDVYASTSFTTPIPKTTVLTNPSLMTLVSTSTQQLAGTDFTNAKNWFPSYTPEKTAPRVSSYSIAIPKLGIDDAFVSTTDYDVGSHLINYGGTAVPPEKGNAVVFGHSTLPQLFNKNDYKTIFAKLHTLKPGDEIKVYTNDNEYTYRVTNMYIVEPNDFKPLTQSYDASYLTLITCTPPGTIWQRLVVRTKLESS